MIENDVIQQVAVVTGAGSGIGRGVALALLQRGYCVVLAGRNQDKLDAVLADSKSKSALAIATDVTKPAEVETLFNQTVEAFSRVDLLFNNAGAFGSGGPLEELAFEEWKSIIDVNLNGAFLCARQAYRCMKHQKPAGGRIINNGSVSAQVPRPDAVAYTSSKHAITGLTKSISLEGRRWNIACGQIDIGNAATNMTRDMQTGMLQADGAVKPEPTMSLFPVVDAVLLMAGLPLHANIQSITVMATGMPMIGRG